jgi:hypothetical protein
MIFKDPEESVEANVNTRWLNHGAVERFNLYAASADFGLNIAIT